MKVIIIIFFIYIHINLFSQVTEKKIDSLLSLLNTTYIDTSKIEIYYQLSWYYKNLDFTKAIDFGNKALILSKNINYSIGIINSYNNLGNAYYYKGEYYSALKFWLDGYKLSEKVNYIKGMARISGNIGLIYEIYEDYNKAIEYQLVSLKLNQNLGNKLGVAGVLNNIGILYHYLGDFDKELEYYLKSLEIRKAINNQHEIASSLNNIGTTYFKRNELKKALNYHFEALEIYNQLQEKKGISETYINIGQIYIELHNFTEAISSLNKSLSLSLEIDYKLLIRANFLALSEVYKNKSDYKTSLEYFKKFSDIKDTIFNENKQQQIFELQTKYETEKKDNEIKVKNLELENNAEEIQKQKILIFSFIVGFIIILVFSILLYRLFIQKKKANLLLAKKNIEVEQKNDEISAQRDLVTQQKNEIVYIHEELTDSINYAKRIQEAVLPISTESRNIMGEHFILFRPKDIVSGDFYWVAKIENTLIVAVADCTGHGVPGAFMSMLGISFLNEIVRKKEIIAANQVLNELRKEIINALQQKGQLGEQKDGMDISLVAIKPQAQSPKFQIPSEDEREKVREGESEQLSVGSTQSTIIDSQFATSTSNFKLQTSNFFQAQWAGANNPLWLIRAVTQSSGLLVEPEVRDTDFQNFKNLENLEEHTNRMFVLQEVKPDKMPIAIYERMDDFTNHEIQLQKGDILYLMSDGYEDQFGGSKGRKFLSKNLKQLILDNSQKPMKQQKDILEKTLIDWIGDGEQIDDITVVGVRI